MTLLKKFFNLALFILCFTVNVNSQNLYDQAHSKQYAIFLEQSRQFRLAAMEFERLVFMDPENLDFKNRLIKSYRYSEQFDQGLNRINDWYPSQIGDINLFQEFIKLSYLQGSYVAGINSLNNQNILPSEETQYYLLSGIVLQKNYNGAIEFIQQYPDNQWPGFYELSDIVKKHQDINFRKPGVALGLSAIIPGLGKVYSKDWKDGLISFLFVATNTFQAYRGFSKDGVNSVYGWVFGTLALGFYTGNLYGSWKSAKDFNLRSEEALYHEIQHSIFDRF